MKNLWGMHASSSMTHGKRSPKAHHWSKRIVRQIETRRMKEVGREMLCVHACNGWEQCRNVLQSFGECHNVTWPICVPTRIRAESRILAWPPLRRKGHPSMVVTMQSSRCIELNELIGNVQQFTDNDTLRMDTTTRRLENYSERIY